MRFAAAAIFISSVILSMTNAGSGLEFKLIENNTVTETDGTKYRDAALGSLCSSACGQAASFFGVPKECFRLRLFYDSDTYKAEKVRVYVSAEAKSIPAGTIREYFSNLFGTEAEVYVNG